MQNLVRMPKFSIFCIFLLFFVISVIGVKHSKKKEYHIDEGFKERIMNIIDSKGEMTQDEKDKMFENLKVAGGKNVKKIEKTLENTEYKEKISENLEKTEKKEEISIEEARKEDL